MIEEAKEVSKLTVIPKKKHIFDDSDEEIKDKDKRNSKILSKLLESLNEEKKKEKQKDEERKKEEKSKLNRTMMQPKEL